VSLRTPLGRVLGHGSAKDGASHWWAQRIGAVALVPLTLWFAIALCSLPALDYATVRAWLKSPLDAFLAILLIGVMAHHAYLGSAVVIEDYVHAKGFKLASLLLARFLYVLCAGAGIFAILRL
jgi:succinate dehydrogenase / fumarate reductase, membrane anchor subunit